MCQRTQAAREEMAEERVLLEQARRDANLRSVGDEEVNDYGTYKTVRPDSGTYKAVKARFWHI